MPHALLIKFPGTNCDAETARALEAAGFTAEVLPVALLDESALDRTQLVVFSGGFSYGDYVMSGWPVRFGGTPPAVGPAPLLGQHSGDVLADWLKMDGAAISTLKSDKVITE